MTGLELLALAFGVALFLGFILYLFFVRRAPTDDLFSSTEKVKLLSKKEIRKEKKKKDKVIKKKTGSSNNRSPKAAADSEDVTEHPKKMLQLETYPEIIEVEPDEAPQQVRNRKKQKVSSGEIKPILVNKDEISPVTDAPIEYEHTKVVKDDVELHHLHEKEDAQIPADANSADSRANAKKNKKKKTKVQVHEEAVKETPKVQEKVTAAPVQRPVTLVPSPPVSNDAGAVKLVKGKKKQRVVAQDSEFEDRPSSPTQEILKTISHSAGIRVDALISGLGGFSDTDVEKLQKDNESLNAQLRASVTAHHSEVQKLKQDNSLLQADIQKAKVTVQEKTKAYQNAQQEVSRQQNLQTTYTLLQTEFQKKISEVKRAELEKASMNDKVKAAEGRLATIDAEVRQLRVELEDTQKTAENERRASKADRATLSELQKKHEALLKDFSAARQAGEGQEDPPGVPNENVDKLVRDLEEQKKKNNLLETQLAGKTQELVKEQGNMKEVESKLSESIGKLDLFAREVNDLQQALKEKTNEIEVLSEKLEGSEKPGDASSSEEVDALKAKNDELRQKNWGLSEALQAAEKKADAASSSSKDKVSEMSKKVADLESELQQAKEKSDKASSETAQLQEELHKYKGTLESTEKVLKDLQSAVEEEETKWKTALTASEAEVEEYKRALASAVGQLKQDRGSADDMEEKVKEMEGKLKVVSDERDEARSAKDRLLSELSNEKDKSGKLETLLQNGQAVNNHVDVPVQQAKADAVRNNSESSDLSASNLNVS